MAKYSLLSILLIFSITNCYSQLETSPTLNDAIYKAIEKNAAIKNKTIEIEKLNLQEKSVRNKYIPTVEANALYSYFGDNLTLDLPTATIPIVNLPVLSDKATYNNSGNFFIGSVMAKTVLFSGMQIPNGANAIKQKAVGTAYLKDSEKDAIIKDVINTFDQLKLINETEKLINDSDKRLQNETKRVTRAIEQGLAIPYDRDKIKLALLELESKKIEITGKRSLIYKKLQYLTGYSDTEINSVDYDLNPYLIDESNLSTENKQEIKALESFKLANEYLLKKEKGTYLPTVGAFGGIVYSSLFNVNGTTSTIPVINQSLNLGLNEFSLSPLWMVGAAMKWEIFASFEREHKVHEAKLNIEQIQNQIDDTKQKLQLLLENNLVNYTVLLKKIEIASQQEKVASNNLNLASKQYKEGLINVSGLLEAENDLFKVSVSKLNTLIEERLATIETIIATGELSNKLSK
ncbi:TolC family protein [Flavobacterium taihuense]|uniref:TolC family protein n=1 Tax=Flavobacterium taihuense TaxID=2857508 RepID=A0ABS6XXA6_9FLAO|nr:TolC family protein [Flavobacterium taihuense]MBW4361316.1 TolC family protein [Flavobacterium taihuense]